MDSVEKDHVRDGMQYAIDAHHGKFVLLSYFPAKPKEIKGGWDDGDYRTTIHSPIAVLERHPAVTIHWTV